MNEPTHPPFWPRLRLCRAPLFHGTGLSLAEAIITEDRLRVADPGIPTVSMTRSLQEAFGFAARERVESRNGPASADGAAIFVLDRERLAHRYRIKPFRDSIWDVVSSSAGGSYPCRHECEEVIWQDIHPLRPVASGVLRFERKGWTWDAWREPHDEKQLHLFERLAA